MSERERARSSVARSPAIGATTRRTRAEERPGRRRRLRRFCEGLRKLCGIDLTQYKRPQMERRLRSFFARHGVIRS